MEHFVASSTSKPYACNLANMNPPKWFLPLCGNVFILRNGSRSNLELNTQTEEEEIRSINLRLPTCRVKSSITFRWSLADRRNSACMSGCSTVYRMCACVSCLTLKLKTFSCLIQLIIFWFATTQSAESQKHSQHLPSELLKFPLYGQIIRKLNTQSTTQCNGSTPSTHLCLLQNIFL